MPDPIVDMVPIQSSILILQEDSTFGKNLNTVSFDVSSSVIHMVTENLSSFTWGPIPIIRPGSMHLHVVVLRMDNYIVYYGCFGAKALRVNLFENRIHNSFYNRLVALYGWFEDKLVR